jgi:putative sterol carrier protein
MLAAFSPATREAAPSSGALTCRAVFDRMPERFRADKAVGVDVVFQFRITGSGGGDWTVSIKDGACAVHEGVHEKPTTIIIMGTEDFLSMIQGKLKAMVAYTSGKLKIEGDLMKSQLIEKLFTFA